MKPFNRYHPFTNFIFFLMVILLTGILQNPLLTLISCLIGVVTFYVFKNKGDHSFGPLFALCLLAGVINPLLSHHGATILFYINDTPITKEACIYGINLTFQLLQLIIWFKLFSLSISSEHILCLFGSFSPRLALLFSMILGFIPRFSGQFKKTENAAKAMGALEYDNIWGKIKGKSKIFLSVSGYALEQGIITADSMEARGYSLSHRSSYRRFKYRNRDFKLTCSILLLSAPMIIAKVKGIDAVVFYPDFHFNLSPYGLLTIVLPGLLLTLIPLFIFFREEQTRK